MAMKGCFRLGGRAGIGHTVIRLSIACNTAAGLLCDLNQINSLSLHNKSRLESRIGRVLIILGSRIVPSLSDEIDKICPTFNHRLGIIDLNQSIMYIVKIKYDIHIKIILT